VKTIRHLRDRLRGDDRGNGVVQLPIMAGTYVLFIMLLVFVGRVNSGYSSAEAGARYAARTIAIARDPTTAVDAARADAATTVRAGSARCRSMDFAHTIDAAQVTVTITCQVDLAEVNILGVPGHWAATATASEPVDQFREGGPS
jgi:Flp pilus assembly protein TadG